MDRGTDTRVPTEGHLEVRDDGLPISTHCGEESCAAQQQRMVEDNLHAANKRQHDAVDGPSTVAPRGDRKRQYMGELVSGATDIDTSVDCSVHSTPRPAHDTIAMSNATGKRVRGGVPTDQSPKKQMPDAAKLSAEEDPIAQAIQAVHHHYAPVTINNNNHFILPSGALGSLLTLCVYDYSISEFVTE